MSCVPLAGCLAGQHMCLRSTVACSRYFSIGHFLLTIQSDSFILVMLIATIDFYHSITHLVALTLIENHKIRRQQDGRHH